MGCGCNKTVSVENSPENLQAGIAIKSLPARIADRSSFVIYDRSLDMISAIRAEELKSMPFAIVLEPAITKVSSVDTATKTIAALSEIPGVYLFEDVLNLTRDSFSSTSCEACFETLQAAVKHLGF